MNNKIRSRTVYTLSIYPSNHHSPSPYGLPHMDYHILNSFYKTLTQQEVDIYEKKKS